MKKPSMKYINGSVCVIFAIYAVMISNGFAIAGDYTMHKNLTDIADLISKWSKQLSTGKLLSQTSQILHDMTMKGQGDMHMDHHNKIMEMEKAWDPFDTSDKM